MNQLYPPNIAGTLPSFYKSEEGTAAVAVPFVINKTVKLADISGFNLRLKTTNTDILFGNVSTQFWSQDPANPIAYFTLPAQIVNRLSIGTFYKVQIAFINTYEEIGYYSSVGIIKYTAKPTVEISDFSLNEMNSGQAQYIGIYSNENDPSERVYQYRFNLFTKSDELVESSGWKLHNSYEDTSLSSSIDKYTLRTALKENIVYKMNYEVTTNNGLQFSSPKYSLIEAESINPELSAKLNAELDYENACINLSLAGATMQDGSEYIVSGAFVLSRSSSLDNFATWLPISTFKLTGQKPSSFILKDYTIVQGATYLYSLQQFNDFDIYSNRILSQHVTARFEDAYLFDGERQLRIRYNPKITSFKTVLQESKKTTLGSKYPFIFRSGVTEYKEFPISGLISYFTDDDELFVSKKNELHIQSWEKTTDIVDDNILLERLFKLKVLDWLNNGKPKLFKSPQEGNYIVRIMNTSLSPIDTVSRMLHNFSCQATEIADYTPENLIEYGLLNTSEVPTYQTKWETIILKDRAAEEKEKLIETAKQKLSSGTYTQSQYNSYIATLTDKQAIKNVDLLRGEKAYYLKVSDITLGAILTYQVFGESSTYQIMIGATGSYEASFDVPIVNLRVSDISTVPLRGSITFSIKTTSQNRFDIITKILHQNIAIFQVNGPRENALSDYQDVKHQVTKINYACFRKKPVQEIYSNLFAMQSNGTQMTGVVEDITNIKYFNIPTIDSEGQVVPHYYRYEDGKLYSEPHYSTYEMAPKVINEYTFYKDTSAKVVYQLKGDMFIKTSIDPNSNKTQYPLQLKDLNTYTIYLKKYYDKEQLKEVYYKYNGTSLQQVPYSTTVQIGDVEIDIGESGEREISDISEIPSFIKIGSGVIAEFGIQVKILEYNVESSNTCKNAKQAYERDLKKYVAMALGLTAVSHKSMTLQGQYKKWENYAMCDLKLNQSELNKYKSGKYSTVSVYTHITDINNLPTQAAIDNAYETLQKSQKNYFSLLEELLKEQEAENSYEQTLFIG